VTDALAIARGIHLAATIVAAGMIFFDLVIARPAVFGNPAAARNYANRLRAWIWPALGIAAASGLVWTLLVAMELSGSGAVFADGTLAKLLTDTRFGHVWLLRFLLLLVVVPTTLSASRPVAQLRLFAASTLLATIAWVGHSNARSDIVGWLQVSADMAHLLAAGLWLGSLPALAMLLSSEAADVSAATRRFSSFGVIAVATLLLTGLFNTYLLTDSVWSLPKSDYGRLLLLKIAVFVAMVVFAAVNRIYWTPKLPAGRASDAIRRHSMIEAGLGLAILFIVGLLGTLPPPLHGHLHSGSDDGAFVHIHDIDAMAEVRLLPGTPGQNTAQILLMQEDFQPLTAKSVQLRLFQQGQPPVTVEAHAIGEGTWRVQNLALPTPGVWTVVVGVTTAAGTALSLDGPIVLDSGSPAKSE
jgi:putative copper resistance protein D